MLPSRNLAAWTGAVLSGMTAVLLTGCQSKPTEFQFPKLNPPSSTEKPVEVTFVDQQNYPYGKRDLLPAANLQSGPPVMAVFRFRTSQPLSSTEPFDFDFDCGDGTHQIVYPQHLDNGDIAIEVTQGYGPLLYKPHFAPISAGRQLPDFKEPANLQILPAPKRFISDRAVHEDSRIRATLTASDKVEVALTKAIPDSTKLSLKINQWTYAAGFTYGTMRTQAGAWEINFPYAIDQRSVDLGLYEVKETDANLGLVVPAAKLIRSNSEAWLEIDQRAEAQSGPLKITVPAQTRRVSTALGHISGDLRVDVTYEGSPLKWNQTGYLVKSETHYSASGDTIAGKHVLFDMKSTQFSGSDPKDVLKPSVTNAKVASETPPQGSHTSSFGPLKIAFQSAITVSVPLFQTVIPIHRGGH
ncbi:MAG TPA: hypothetical protein VG944_21630 [Fimbriimonas sp.]|nr:hypothetical protein [Fimbriimonas sp.]